jgi:arginine N-succinyltransferase
MTTATGPAGGAPIAVVARPARDDDAGGLWTLLRDAGAEVMGMSSLPGSLSDAESLCAHSAETVADLAAGSLRLDEGQASRIVLLAVDVDGRILGLTGVTLKSAVPNLAVRVATGEDGLGLVMRSSSVPWTRTELDSSYIGPDGRGRGVGTLLSRGRLMLLQLVASQIPSTVASHLRGRFDDDGTAPFWRCFGAHLAPQWQNSTEAELALIEDPSRLGDLAGHVRPLSAVVLESMGAVNAASMPAFHLLRAEGLRPNGMYDPIDGGPTVVAELADTATGQHRTWGRARLVDGRHESSRPGTDSLVSVTSIDRFRVIRAPVGLDRRAAVTIDAERAASAGIEADDLLAVTPVAAPAPHRPLGPNR